MTDETETTCEHPDLVVKGMIANCPVCGAAFEVELVVEEEEEDDDDDA